MMSQQELRGAFSDRLDGDVQSEEDFLKELTAGTSTTPEAFRRFMEGDSSVSDEDEDDLEDDSENDDYFYSD
jgi:hypothetical protein